MGNIYFSFETDSPNKIRNVLLVIAAAVVIAGVAIAWSYSRYSQEKGSEEAKQPAGSACLTAPPENYLDCEAQGLELKAEYSEKGCFSGGECVTKVISVPSPEAPLFPGGMPTGSAGTKPPFGGTGGGTMPGAGKCGDGTCDTIEKTNNVCPEDCSSSGTGTTPPSGGTTLPGGTGTVGKCGDGICGPIEKEKNLCPQDCSSSSTGGVGTTTPPPGGTTPPSGGAGGGKCGDGICDAMETANPTLCPADCTQ